MGSAKENSLITSEWLDSETLAYCVYPHPPNVWDSTNEETAVLDQVELSGMAYRHMVFSKRNNILATSSETGHIILWQKVMTGSSSKWEPLHKIEVGIDIFQIYWGVVRINIRYWREKPVFVWKKRCSKNS